ncbi:LacI family DNA-binding transcriptional regulator [Ulvibacterium marinum]|uniref:LacI family transcriptional regulator n=1 Tax=Ulvibacterium marinum TaxID=2419782 RepID=A0A3B0CED5_9FLAO|nr:LacI family DNA-binding transcriptional regulator [Ulvibacterium marinum]RKN83441.1 LacI family transcriptional regulator [Ulvibacterium marinum]
MARVSQKDIAIALNLSRVTVTKALKDHPDISDSTKKQIKEKAKELGYIPDLIGRSLSSGRTKTIGVILPKIAHSFFAYAVERFYEYAHERDYNIIPMVSFEDSEKEKKNIDTLLSMRVDGIIIDTVGIKDRKTYYNLINKSGTKILFFDRAPIEHPVGAVVADDMESSYQLTKLLLQKKYVKICHFGGPSGISITEERRKGYERAIQEVGISAWVILTDMTKDDGYTILRKLGHSANLPDAVIAINDSVAQGAHKAALEMGLEIPSDIAIAGFGDLTTSRIMKPSLTTVRMPLKEMTKYTIDLIIDMIENETTVKGNTIFKGELIEREST